MKKGDVIALMVAIAFAIASFVTVAVTGNQMYILLLAPCFGTLVYRVMTRPMPKRDMGDTYEGN